jgi:glycosyltransferase involved in cell wall biosynthesis
MTIHTSNSPSLSVIFCTNVWNTFCDRALSSIELQTFVDFEIIIVANCIDNLDFERLKIRATDSRVRVFKTSVSGVTFSRNLALHHCRAPLIAVMDADDISYPCRFAVQVEFFRLHPEVMVCGSNFDVIDAQDNKLKTCYLPKSNLEIRNSLVWRNPLCHPTIMLRTVCLRNVGGYGACNSNAEDYDLWVRIAEDADLHFANLSDSLLGYRIPVVSIARRSRRAYAFTSSVQFRTFVLKKQPLWLLASILTFFKLLFCANRQ